MPDDQQEHPTLAAALVAFQAELPRVRKEAEAIVPTKTGGQYKYTYADLSDLTYLLMPILTRHGLAFTAGPDVIEGVGFVLRWSLVHGPSGEERTGAYPLPGGNTTPQQIGSAITYGRRYALVAVTGVAPDDDDDGAAAEQAAYRQHQQPADTSLRGRATAAQQQADADRRPPQPITDKTMKALHASFGEIGIEEREDKIAYVNATLAAFAERRGIAAPTIGSTTELTESQAKIVVAAIKADAEGVPRG